MAACGLAVEGTRQIILSLYKFDTFWVGLVNEYVRECVPNLVSFGPVEIVEGLGCLISATPVKVRLRLTLLGIEHG